MNPSKTVHTLHDLRFVDHVFKGVARWMQHRKVSFLTWPDGMPCNYANLYLLHLMQRDLSTSGRGGSIKQYAHIISRYIVFCYTNRVGLMEISNAQFSLFVGSLRFNTASNTRNAESTVITNAKIVLDFLSFTEKRLQVSIVGPRLGAQRAVTSYQSNKRTFKGETWSHPSFGTSSPKKRRSAIESGTIESLLVAAEQSSLDEYVVSRRQIFVKTLEITGARVGECAEIRVADIEAARSSLMLRVITLKRGEPHSREIPILSQDLTDLEEFLIHRKVAIKAAKLKDDGYLFFSTKSGRHMTAASLSNEIGILRRLSGISEQASAHLFRHRFITKVIIYLIEAHEFETPNHMRRALQEIESLKLIVTEWTGHASIGSIDTYIDAAFSEWKGLSRTVDKSFAKRALEKFAERAEKLAEKVGASLSVEDFQKEFQIIRRNLQDDMARNTKSTLVP